MNTIKKNISYGLILDQKLKPNTFEYDFQKPLKPKSDFIISKDKEGKILSLYGDDTWNLNTYATSPIDSHKILFSKNILNSRYISDAKWLTFLYITYGPGRTSLGTKVSTIVHFFIKNVLVLYRYAESHNIELFHIIEKKEVLDHFIKNNLNTYSASKNLLSLLNFMHILDNRISGIHYTHNETIIKKLLKISDSLKNTQQTIVIPSRILFESIRQRWEQILEVETYLTDILEFMLNIQQNSQYGIKCKQNKYDWENITKNHILTPFFDKYQVKGRTGFIKLILLIQGTCKHLIHAYTGMRNSEVLNLKENCLESVENSKVAKLIGLTTKTTKHHHVTKWVTTNEIERVIKILCSFNTVLRNNADFEYDDSPLFLRSTYLIKKWDSSHHITSDITRRSLPLDFEKLKITQEDLSQLELIEYGKYWNQNDKYKIDDIWEFKSHQYRRSLAVYSLSSGLVSISALQTQFKHLFQEMTLYYGCGFTEISSIFNADKEHIGNERQKLKPELDAIMYIKQVLFSDEKNFGAYGLLIENNIKTKNVSEDIYILENREQTVKKFKRGEQSFKETALGGCVKVGTCSEILSRSIIGCIGCESAIHKKSKVQKSINIIEKQLHRYEPNSIEYRTEHNELNILKKYEKTLQG